MQTLTVLSAKIGPILKQKNLFLATAESCTGGLVAEIVTAIPGSSHWFDRGFVTYSNKSKQEMLGVAEDVIKTFGAVSEQTVRSMAEGAIKNSDAQVAIAITGIAGPAGGTIEKPVGTIWIAWVVPNQNIKTLCFQFKGSRLNIRKQSAKVALQELLLLIKEI